MLRNPYDGLRDAYRNTTTGQAAVLSVWVRHALIPQDRSAAGIDTDTLCEPAGSDCTFVSTRDQLKGTMAMTSRLYLYPTPANVHKAAWTVQAAYAAISDSKRANLDNLVADVLDEG